MSAALGVVVLGAYMHRGSQGTRGDMKCVHCNQMWIYALKPEAHTQ
jgi:hypothetical protein